MNLDIVVKVKNKLATYKKYSKYSKNKKIRYFNSYIRWTIN
jgi:hypothetical protein